MASGASILQSPTDYSTSSHEKDSKPSGASIAYSDGVRELEAAQLPRSASYTYFPHVEDVSAAPNNSTIKRTFSDEVLTAHINENVKLNSNDVLQRTKSSLPKLSARDNLVRSAFAAPYDSPKITISKFNLPPEGEVDDISYEPNTVKEHTREGRLSGKPRNFSESLSTFARNSWVSPSRSPSPSTREGDDSSRCDTNSTARSSVSSSSPRKTLLLRRNTDKSTKGGSYEVPNPVPRKDTLLPKKTKRPLSSFLKNQESTGLASHGASVQTVSESSSTDKLPSLIKFHPSSERVPPVPRSLSSDRLQGTVIDLPRKKDELWNIFRGLEGDYHKFQSKSIALKANVVRSSLLPFLRTYAQHTSIRILRPEDLDRRVNILNKWWTGLLELLDGRNNHSISGTDRPVLLEGMAGIMVRSEWRLNPSPFAPLKERSAGPSWTSRSSVSLQSTASEFLADSVCHNVRNMFVQNLLAQTSFVVDKMSVRSTPASLVAFCGKALAYAFFFCPGVADILVRQWALSTDALRRVLEEYDISRTSNLKAISELVVPGFPPCMQSLGFSSLPATVRHLRKPASPPFGMSNIPWDGPWIGRWSGRDSDLFFVFAKYFHVLAVEFLPSGIGRSERVCVPALVLVHAHILTLLGSTIHRHLSHSTIEHSSGPSSITFDDVLSGADASAAAALPLPPTKVVRLMAENRLIMLLRDFLFEQQSDCSDATRIFAETFSDLLKAAVRKISLFDHSACFTLCDFMEEAIAILVRYQTCGATSQTFFDWPFWLNVCRQMTASENSMTEIRLFAFLYSIWGTITDDVERKRDLCLGWLLSEGFFEKHFNHWCPMVRAYYMRLLCWRLARYDGEESDLDLEILQTLSDRLRCTWSHFQYLRDQSARQRLIPPSTAPCNPAPGRRLLIIRSDNHISPGGMFLPLDGIVPPSTSAQPTVYRRHPSLRSVARTSAGGTNIDVGTLDGLDLETPPSAGRRRWSFLRNIMSFGNLNHDSTKLKRTKSTTNILSVSPNEMTSHSLDIRAQPGTTTPVNEYNHSEVSESENNSSRHASVHHLRYSFKFSLEWMERPQYASKDRRLYPPRLPMPAQLYLQSKHGKSYEIPPAKPSTQATSSSKYSGRALAEWALVIIECQNFFERRKNEGIPCNKWIETPTLGVESFRRPG